MKIILLVLFSFCCIISSKSRLIENITERTLTTEKKTGSSPTVRVARQAEVSREDDLNTEISKEDPVRSDEDPRFNNKKERQFKSPPELARSSRNPKGPSERVDKPLKNLTTSSASTPTAHARPKSKSTLVKKPIPKYNEMDYDDDFQMKINKSPVKVVDSGEHEDEDFNLNDYDFDVNHDEFVGRGKPLEPLKHKEILEIPETVKPEHKPAVPSENNYKIKGSVSSSHRGSSKKGRSTEHQKKRGEKEDYYDEGSASANVTEKTREAEDEFNEENEESKEYDSKMISARLVRSPQEIDAVTDKFEEKHFGMSKLLSILPMFPQIPSKGNNFEYITDKNSRNHD